MPDDIDYGTADQAYDQLHAAFTADVPVVIADFTVTAYCDCAALRRVLAVQGRAAACHAELHLAVPLASPGPPDTASHRPGPAVPALPHRRPRRSSTPDTRTRSPRF